MTFLKRLSKLIKFIFKEDAMQKILTTCFCFFLFSFVNLFSENEDPLSHLEGLSETVELTDGLPSNIVNNSVSAISGEYIDHSVDVVLHGPRPLVFGRTYSNFISNGSLSKSWNNNHYSFIYSYEGFYKQRDVSKMLFRMPQGSNYMYKKEKHRGALYNLIVPKGLTNGPNENGARTNIKNTIIHFDDKKEFIVTREGDGSVKNYLRGNDVNKHVARYIIASDENPRNHVLEYQNNGNIIRSKSSLTGLVYATINMKLHPDFMKNPIKYLTTSDGRKIVYKYLKHKYKITYDDPTPGPNGAQGGKSTEKYECFYLKEVEKPHAPSEKYEYTQRDSDKLLNITCKRLPDSRYLRNAYYKKGKNELGGPVGAPDLGSHDYRMNRVKKQMAPVGEDDKPVTVYRFDYRADIKKHGKLEEVRKGHTDVYDAYWHKTIYSYDKYHRLAQIAKNKGAYPSKYARYSSERFFWGKDENADNLVTKYLINPQDERIHHGFNFRYDGKGNTLVKELFGQLTGRSELNIPLNDSYLPVDTGYERETITYTYSNDKFNLMLSETNSDGKTVAYHYYPNTDILFSKFIQYDGAIRLREFYYYDQDRNLTKKISDDGQSSNDNDLGGATRRLITYYFPQNKIPYGLNARVDEMYYDFDAGQEILLNRVENTYSAQGHLLEQKTFDAKGRLAFVVTNAYDAHGNVIREVNPLGEITTKEYDKNDNLIARRGPHPDYSVIYTYDYSNRLIKQEEIHSDGIRLVQTCRYNYLNQKIATKDHFGNETLYFYNDVGQLKSKQFPTVPGSNNRKVNPEIKMRYDIGGTLTCLKNTSGNEIHCVNNIRGKPISVTYEDGNQEKMFYRLDGELVQKIEQNGSSVIYTVDPIGRRINEELIGSDGQFVNGTRRTYNAFSLLSEDSSDGTIVDYTYNGAGRLVKTHKNQVLIQEVFYDSLGRVNRLHDYYDTDNYRVTVKDYDLLNRPLEERIESSDGTLLHHQVFGYDCLGNKTLIQIGDQATHTSYNSAGKPTKIVDAMGNVTHIHYNYQASDEFGQRVLEVTTVDPLGIQTIQRYDALNRLARTSRKNSLSELLSDQTLLYDLSDNCVCVIDHCIYEARIEKSISTVSVYDVCSRLIKLIEADGTSEQKSTSYRFNAIGQKVAKIKSDGIELLYDYDNVGRIKEFTSSDNSIKYLYSYDIAGNLVSVIDAIDHTENRRVYNGFGQLTEETLNNGLAVQFRSDLFDRFTAVTLPDRTEIRYVYDPAYLKEVHRIVDDQLIYSQSNTDYTVSGLIKREMRPGKVGQQTYDYDRRDRIQSIQVGSFHQTIPTDGFDAAGNLKKYDTNEKASAFTYDDLYQITSEDGLSNHSYAYDSLSNRRIKDKEKQEVNNLNQLLPNEKTSFTYDVNGNLTEMHSADETVFYGYDALDRLVRSERNGLEVAYRYDSFNRRVSKKIGDRAEILYFYQDVEEIGSWSDDRIVELKVLNQGNRKSVAIELDAVPYVPVQDLFGHVVKLYDLDGNLQESYSYSVFGEMIKDSREAVGSPESTESTDSSVKSPWLYSNRRFDSETGLIVFNLRYYDPRIGRWISPDPAGFGDGPNLYAHVHNNTLKYYDLLGLFASEHNFSFTSTLNSAINWTSSQIFFLPSLLITPNFGEKSGYYEMNDGINSKDEKNIDFKRSDNRAIMFCNGICTDQKSFNGGMSRTAMLANHYVVGHFDKTHGFLVDSLEYFFRQFLGFTTQAEKQLRHSIMKVLDKSPDADLLIVAHSRGCVDVRNVLRSLPNEIRQRIDVLAVAPGGYIDKYLCRSVIHLVSKGDPIPWIDFFGRRRCKDTIVELDPHPNSFRFFDHSYTSPTYTNSVKYYTNRSLQNGML